MRIILYYLAVLCVAKYRSILESVDRIHYETETTELAPTNQGNIEGDRNLNQGGRETNNSSEERVNISPTGNQSSQIEAEKNQSENERTLPSQQDGDDNSNVRNVQREVSHDTECSVTPDLGDNTFSFTMPPTGIATAVSSSESERGGVSSSVPASITFYRQSMDTSEQIELGLKLVGPVLCDVLVNSRSGLSRVLVGSDGRLLLNDGRWGVVFSEREGGGRGRGGA